MAIASLYPSIFPSLNLDFANVGALDPRITFTRASTATYFDQLGVLQTAQANEPRFDYNPSTLAGLGLLIEEQRTNSIRNNTMQGAVAGTPGTLPTNWTSSNIGGVALTEIVGTGIENGITYIDVRYTGTTSSTAAGGITAEAAGVISASSGQNWTNSFYVRLIGGSTSGITNIFNTIQGRDAGLTLLEATNTAITPTTAALNTQKVSTTRTLSNASTAFVNPQVRIVPASGVAIDITLRIGLPQLELGAFATSVIPTTTTALTRSADVASMTGTNFSSWFNAAEGTFVSEAEFTNTVSFNTVYDVNNGTTNNRIRTIQWNDGSNRRLSVTDGNVLQATITGTGGVNVFRFAAAYKENDFAACQNGGAVGTDTSGTVPSVNQMGIGCYGPVFSTFFLSGWIRRIIYYPTRLSDAQLQALTG